MKKHNKIHTQNYKEIEERGKRLEVLYELSKDIRSKTRRTPLPFNDFLHVASSQPVLAFRDVFQVFHDMVHHFVPDGIEEYPQHQNSIGFVGYDCEDLFVKNCDNPFFADRLFANRFMKLVNGFKQGTLRNHIFLFEGPPGSGKSTFLNNILLKMEEYTHRPEGALFKTYWRLDIERLGGFQNFSKKFNYLNDESSAYLQSQFKKASTNAKDKPMKHLEFSCPRHDHPILQIPKDYRKKFLDALITDEEFKEKLFHRKEYEWVLTDVPCNICSSVFEHVLEIVGEPLEVFDMIGAKRFRYNRQFGEGISVFNPGDMIYRKPIENVNLQKMINNLLRTDNVDFIYSDLAKTNNGVLALMDIKEHNIERLKNLHGVISDGVHKVQLIEEQIKSFFIGLVNPEDKHHFENVKSFQDRIVSVDIPYILDFKTEVSIYKNKFGNNICKKFLPRVLDNFAKIIISSRMLQNSPGINRWISNTEKYRKYLDKNKLLLKMDVYTGTIPSWLSDDDLNRFDKNMRKSVLADSDKEGKKGFSGRQSIQVFNEFINKFKNGKIVTMEDIKKFFGEKKGGSFDQVPIGFVASLEDLYNYNVLQEVKEAIYYYNEDQIVNDIKNYLFAINYEPDVKKVSEFTGEELHITDDFFKNFEGFFLGTTSTEAKRKEFRKDVHKEYITKTLSVEISLEKKKIEETDQFKSLLSRYTRTLKENALAPYATNDNFRRAILDYGKEGFKTYDNRLRRDVNLLIDNLVSKFGYTKDGARQVSLYVLDKNLVKKY
jgi:predicted Ser/Thr protein kinase